MTSSHTNTNHWTVGSLSLSLSLLLLSVGCEIKIGEETPDCTRTSATIDMSSMGASGDDCSGTSSFQNLDGCAFDDYITYGNNSSTVPAVDDHIVTARTSGSCQGATAGRTRAPSDYSGISGTEDWYASGGTTTFLDCNDTNCSSTDNSGCNGTYKVTIQDDNISCNKYDDVHIWLRGFSVTSKRMMDSDADCTTGDGSFQLVPIQASDDDGDGDYSVAFLPLMSTGSGVMTRASWVDSIDNLDIPSGYTVRVIKSDTEFEWNANDLLVNASTVSNALSTTNTFNSGVIDGNPIFVVSEVDEDDLLDFSLDIEWTCGGSYTSVSSPQGYQFALSDIGCTGYDQKLTLRYDTGPNRVSLEQYGTAAVGRTEPTATVVDGEAFTFDRENLLIEGVILSHDSTEAEVRLDTIQADGVNVCSTGTYTFAVE